jgi:DNA-binding response OmpR family regulator
LKINRHTDRRSVLLVSPDEPDYLALRGIVQAKKWTVLQAHNPIEARQALYGEAVDAVIADSKCWKSLLAEMWTLGFPLIVADRLADERLWGEALNLGAFDLVAKPFEANVVLHVLSGALRRRSHGIKSLSLKFHGCPEGQRVESSLLKFTALAHP